MIITLPQLAIFMLVMGRVVGLFVSAPFLDTKQILSPAKIALVIWLSGLIIFAIPLSAKVPQDPFGFIFAMVTEFLVGVMLGFVSNIFLAGIEMAGSLMDTQAGLSVASVLDPSSGQNAALLQQWFKWIAMIIFVIVGGDRMLIEAIYKSFFLIPVGHPVNLSAGAYEIMGLFKNIFLIGVQLSAPILLVVFIVDYAFGIMNRVAEQINVFQLGFQIKPTVSIFILMTTLPGLVYVMNGILSQVLVYMMQVLKALVLKSA